MRFLPLKIESKFCLVNWASPINPYWSDNAKKIYFVAHDRSLEVMPKRARFSGNGSGGGGGGGQLHSCYKEPVSSGHPV